jgi:topoisomerase-4 subunit A
MAKFALSAVQAEDILEIRLRQLARLEGIRIERELDELKEEESALRRLLAEGKEMSRLVVREIEQDAKRYGDERRTLIEPVAALPPAELQVPDEAVTVILSKNGWVRRREGHGLDRTSIAYKAGDYPFFVAETRTTWPLIVIDTNGRAYSLRVADIPGGRGDGTPIATMIDLQAGGRIAAALTDAPEARYLFANSGGYGFIAKVADLVSRQKAGKSFMSLEQDERVLAPAKVAGSTVAAVSESGRLLMFDVGEMKSQSAGRGVLIMGLDKAETLVGVTVNDGSGVLVEGIGRGGKTVPCKVAGEAVEKYRLHRARKGCRLPVKMKPAFIL